MSEIVALLAHTQIHICFRKHPGLRRLCGAYAALRWRNRRWNVKTTYSIFDHVARYDVRISRYEVLMATTRTRNKTSPHMREIFERRYKHYDLNIQTILHNSNKLKSDKRTVE